MMEWISVKERLPNYETAVLVYCPQSNNIYCAFYSFASNWIYFIQGCDVKICEDVTRWMPLPESPKEESPPPTFSRWGGKENDDD